MFHPLITQNFISNICLSTAVATISSITLTCKNIFNLCNNSIDIAKKDSHIDLEYELKKLDLQIMTKIIQDMLEELDLNMLNYNSIIFAIESIKQIIKDIEFQLSKLNSYLNYNNSLWVLKNFRSYECTTIINTLKDYKIIMIDRKNILVDLLKIKNDLRRDIMYPSLELSKINQATDPSFVVNCFDY